MIALIRFALAAPLLGVSGTTEPPNIMFILADDLGMMDLEPYNPGNFDDSTKLPRLASRAKRFPAGDAGKSGVQPDAIQYPVGQVPDPGRRHELASLS